MSTCLILQHVEPEGPGAIGDALQSAGVNLRFVRAYAGDSVPKDPTEFDGLVVMGGPMSANSDVGFPTLHSELDLIEAAVGSGVPTLGVCLGAQLLARTAGAKIFAGEAGLEVGWAEIELLPDAGRDPLLSGLPAVLPVLHWHGETFTLPDGAAHLASSEMYPNQAFRLGESAWGLQFHLEASPEMANTFAASFPEDLIAAGTDPAEVAARGAASFGTLLPQRDVILARFTALVTSN